MFSLLLKELIFYLYVFKFIYLFITATELIWFSSNCLDVRVAFMLFCPIFMTLFERGQRSPFFTIQSRIQREPGQPHFHAARPRGRTR